MRNIRSALAIPSMLLVLAACGGGGESPGSSSTTSGSGGGTGGSASTTTTGTGGSMDPPPPPPMRKKISGDITWQVTFDDAAKAAGATDCSYTRHYEGHEDRSAPWLCPTCEIMFRADVTVTQGLTDCYAQVATGTPAAVEWLGYDANGTFERSGGWALSDQGTVTQTAAGFDTSNAVMDQDAPVGGKLGFDVAGTLTVTDEEGDVMNGFTPPATYACGWPKADPPAYTGDYVLAKGSMMPDGLFKDACDEPVRLHDLAGAYLFVEMSARNCGPCQQMAAEEEKFIADMAAQGIEVRVITLLCPALEDVYGNTTKSMLKSWITKYGLTSPVLADRAWGLTMFEPLFGTDNVGYPSWALVAPDLTVIDAGTGFSSFADIQTLVLADAKP